MKQLTFQEVPHRLTVGSGQKFNITLAAAETTYHLGGQYSIDEVAAILAASKRLNLDNWNQPLSSHTQLITLVNGILDENRRINNRTGSQTEAIPRRNPSPPYRRYQGMAIG